MPVILRNNATSLLASSLTTGATSLSVTAGDGGKYPAPGAGQWFPVTVVKASGVLEVMRCTARTGDVLTVARAQEGTTAQSFNAGDRVELRITNAAMSEFGQLTSANTWSAQQTFTSVLKSTSMLLLDNGGDDTPEIQFKGLTWSSSIDQLGSQLRSFAYNGSTTLFPFQFNHSDQTVYFYGAYPWTSANFNPAAYLPVGGVAANSQLLDGIDSSGFVVRRQANTQCQGTQLFSGAMPSMGVATAGQAPLTLNNDYNTAASICIDFRREGSFVAFFGIDTDNQFKVGGGSFGNNSYPIWHDQNGKLKAILAQAEVATGGVGSYGFLRNVTGGVLGIGGLVLGSNLRYTDTTQSGGNGATGTWRCMGECLNGAGSVFLRVS